MQRIMIRTEGRQVTLAEYYHGQTVHTRAGLMTEGRRIDWSARPAVFKEYPDADVIELTHDDVKNTMPTGKAVEARRAPVEALGPGAMTLAELSTLLRMTNGVTSEMRSPGVTYYLRSAPSAGALYPTVTYVLARNVDGLAPGLYHYGVKGHKLHRLKTGDGLAGELADASAGPHLIRQGSVTLVFSAVFFRSSWKYGRRAYRYCNLDTGHVAGNATLAAAALGYASKLIGRFDDAKVNALLELDEGAEGALLIVPIGKPASAPPAGPEPAFALNPRKLQGPSEDLLLLAHGQTGLQMSSAGARTPGPQAPSDKPYKDLPQIALPRNFAAGEALFDVIARRRSARNWGQRGMTLAELSSVLYHAMGLTQSGQASHRNPAVQGCEAINLYLIVNNVRGMDRGVYYYRRLDHALTALRKGDFRQDSYEISLDQRVVGRADVALIKTIDVRRLGATDGDRGYRYAALSAGLIGESLYLQAEAIGLGCGGIGAFFDDEVSRQIGVSPDDELVIYMSAIGVRPARPAR